MSLPAASESRVVLRGVRWATYERLLAEVDAAGCRLTYDDGALEIVSPSRMHERHCWRISRAVEALAEELCIPLQIGGAMGFRSPEQARGFQPDACYWVQHETRMREEREFDPATDPAPDLVLEIEVTRSALDKLAIFAALGVGEVWRYDGARLAVHVRDGEGFAAVRASRCFPWLPIEEFAAQLAAAAGQDETAWLRSFRGWVRSRLLPGRS